AESLALETDIDQFETQTQTLREIRYFWIARHLLAMRALWRGDLDDADRLIEETRALGERARDPGAEVACITLSSRIRREQGRHHEVDDTLRTFHEACASAFPDHALDVSCGLARLHIDAGRYAEARAVFERVARDGFSGLRRGHAWLADMG